MGRKEVANSREDPPEEVPEKKEKKKGAGFAFAEPEEIPEVEYAEPEEPPPEETQEEKSEVPELNLTPKQNKMRTDLEMWLMDEIPALFGVDDSEELPEKLQEDGQADKITFLIAESDEGAQDKMANDWLKDAPEDSRGEFVTE